MSSTPFVWNIDPVLMHLGPLAIRYYGLCFGSAILTGFLVWYHRVLRFGRSPDFAAQLLYLGVPAVLIGGRLGYCLFYAPRTFLAQPWRIVAIWQGGIVSHGVAIGITLALWVMARRNRLPLTLLGDYLVPAVALAVGWIRVGNFFNSEVIGRPASVPWAVVFAHHDLLPRHPAQLYDLMLGPITYLLLRAIERRHIRPIGSGLISGVFLTTYFGLRLYVETFKDFYTEQARELPLFSWIEHAVGFPIHTGQWLSLPAVAAGIFLTARALRTPPLISAKEIA